MLHLKNEATNDLAPFSPPTSASRELEHWENLIFAFDMEREQPSGSRNTRNTQGSRTPSASNTTGQQHLGLSENAALLAQLEAAARTGELSHAYASMLSQNPYPSMNPSPGFYGNFLQHNPMPPPPSTQLPPLSSLDFPWHALPPQHMQAGPVPLPQHYGQHQGPIGPGQPPLPFLDTSMNPGPSTEPARSSRRMQRSPSTPRASHSTSSPEVEMSEAERHAIAEEKRRRNTAASARFRVKKKHRTIQLERSVSDLTGRAEELEREAADLRRENGWLKEIVMLKGARYAASSMANSEALAQAAALAASEQRAAASSSSAVASSSRLAEKEDVSSGSEESDSSDEDVTTSGNKGKGKQPASKRK